MLSPPQLMDYGKLVWRECLAKIHKTLECKAVILTNFDKLWGACLVSKIWVSLFFGALKGPKMVLLGEYFCTLNPLR